MGREVGGAVRRSWFVACIAAVVGLMAIQTIAHLLLVLGAHRIGTLADLDRSNGLPDVLSTLGLGAAAVGAAALARRARQPRRGVAVALAAGLALLTAADVLHVGAHPTSRGTVVAGVACAVGFLLVPIALTSARLVRRTFAAAGVLLVGSFLVNGIDRYAEWFERRRGDPIAEYQIVLKEGLELLGWALVALALWSEARRERPAALPAATARASRGRAAPRRRAA